MDRLIYVKPHFTVVGIGDYTGNGTDDVLFRNSSTGDTGYYKMVNGVDGGWVDVGPSAGAYKVVP